VQNAKADHNNKKFRDTNPSPELLDGVRPLAIRDLVGIHALDAWKEIGPGVPTRANQQFIGRILDSVTISEDQSLEVER
jgi:hypothetical protein